MWLKQNQPDQFNQVNGFPSGLNPTSPPCLVQVSGLISPHKRCRCSNSYWREEKACTKTENKRARERSARAVVDLVMSLVIGHIVTSGGWLLGPWSGCMQSCETRGALVVGFGSKHTMSRLVWSPRRSYSSFWSSLSTAAMWKHPEQAFSQSHSPHLSLVPLIPSCFSISQPPFLALFDSSLPSSLRESQQGAGWSV